MQAQQNATAPAMAGRPEPVQVVASPSIVEFGSELVSEVIERLPGSSPRFVACAPGRLDVMGGIAEYSGALVLSTTLADHVCVAAQRRDDGKLMITTPSSAGPENGGPTIIAVNRLVSSGAEVVSADSGREFVAGDSRRTELCVLGTVVEMVRANLLPGLGGGLSISVGSTMDGLTDVGHSAAVGAAVLAVVAASAGAHVEPMQGAVVCQRMENDWLAMPVGIADAVCCLLGEPNALLQLQCEIPSIASPTKLPDELVLSGVDCGVVLPNAPDKYKQVRTATFMGCALVELIMRHDGRNPGRRGSHLSRVSITDYVEHVRDRIPTKMKGSEFLSRFGETGDPLTRIDPDVVYKIRSRTEHHIYEHSRTCQFAQFLSRAIRNGDSRPLKEAGGLMYASHWSYGQRCGLGSVETDRLITLIRAQRSEAGIYGAKISGRGCGGVVVVLMQSTSRAHEALATVMQAYQEETGHRPQGLRGSRPGVLVSGVRQVSAINREQGGS